MPAEVDVLSQATVRRAEMLSDPAGDNLMLEIVLPRSVRAVLDTYIERSSLPYVKDAFVVGESMDQTLGQYRRIMAAEGGSLDEVMESLDAADARACLVQAMDATPARLDSAPGGAEQRRCCVPSSSSCSASWPPAAMSTGPTACRSGRDPAASWMARR